MKILNNEDIMMTLKEFVLNVTTSPPFAWACTTIWVITKLITFFIIALTPATGNLIAALAAIATAGLSLYFTLTGYAIMTGVVEIPLGTFVKQSVKCLFILAFGYFMTGF
jgi:hypothetical protein